MSYSEECGGQNKNNAIIGFYEELTNNGLYHWIDHKCLERGHTYLESDRNFAQIETKKKTAEVFVPDDWVHIIEETNLRKPFVATKMQQVDFHDWKSWKSYMEECYKLILKDNDGDRIWLRHPLDEFWVGQRKRRKQRTGDEASPLSSLGAVRISEGRTLRKDKNSQAWGSADSTTTQVLHGAHSTKIRQSRGS